MLAFAGVDLRVGDGEFVAVGDMVTNPHRRRGEVLDDRPARTRHHRYDRSVPSTTYSRVRDLLAKGENDSAATLAIRALGPPVLRYLRAILRDEDDTKDAFSHWAESMWHGLPGFHWKSSLQTWAYRLAYHAALGLRDEAWRRHGRRFETGEASRIAATIRTATGSGWSGSALSSASSVKR